MEEIRQIILRHKDTDLNQYERDLRKLIDYSSTFYHDVTEIYDIVTRIKNVKRNPTGYGFNDAAILGLLIRTVKILKEVVKYYKIDNGDIVSLLDRQIIESAVTAKYLIIKGEDVIEDYRKCSYKDRLKILTDAERSPEFYKSPPGIRLKQSIIEKFTAEGFTINSFDVQKKNNWKLDGKTFYEIFSEVEPPEFYKLLYGIPSESIHGSWNDSMDYHLLKNKDGTFSAYLNYQPVDIRMVTPLLRITNDVYLLWLKRIDAEMEYITKTFQWINTVNIKLYNLFESALVNFDG